MALANTQQMAPQQMASPRPKASLAGAFQRGAQALASGRRQALLAQGESVVRQALQELSDEGVLAPEERQQFELADYGQPEVVGQALSTLSALRKTRRIDKEIEDKVLRAVPAHMGEEQAAEWALTEGALRLSPQAAARFQQTFGWMEDLIGKRKAVKEKQEDTIFPVFANWLEDNRDKLDDPQVTTEQKRAILAQAPAELMGYKPMDSLVRYIQTNDPRATRNALSEASANRKATKELLDEERSFRNEMKSAVGDFDVVQTAFNTINSLGQNPSASDQIALVYAFMKVLDPTSAVREAEYNTAASTAGVTERLFTSFQKALDGEQLGPTQVQKLIDSARKLYASKLGEYKSKRQQYRRMAVSAQKRLGAAFDVDSAVPDFTSIGSTFSRAQIDAEIAGAMARGKTTGEL